VYHFSMQNNIRITWTKFFPFPAAALLFAWAALLLSQPAAALSPDEIIAALRLPENSTGNIADAAMETTGARGWMSSDIENRNLEDHHEDTKNSFLYLLGGYTKEHKGE
jgi:hypothetical protein